MELEWLQKIGEQNSEGKRELLSRYKPYSTRTFQIVLPLALFLFLNKITWMSLPESEKVSVDKFWGLQTSVSAYLGSPDTFNYYFFDMTHSIMCPSLEPNHVMWCMMPGLCYSYSGLSLIPTGADRNCSNLSSGKHTPHFLESLGLGVDEATDDPVLTPHRRL